MRVNNGYGREGEEKSTDETGCRTEPFFSKVVSQEYSQGSQKGVHNCRTDRVEIGEKQGGSHHIVVERTKIHIADAGLRTNENEVTFGNQVTDDANIPTFVSKKSHVLIDTIESEKECGENDQHQNKGFDFVFFDPVDHLSLVQRLKRSRKLLIMTLSLAPVASPCFLG